MKITRRWFGTFSIEERKKNTFNTCVDTFYHHYKITTMRDRYRIFFDAIYPGFGFQRVWIEPYCTSESNDRTIKYIRHLNLWSTMKHAFCRDLRFFWVLNHQNSLPRWNNIDFLLTQIGCANKKLCFYLAQIQKIHELNMFFMLLPLSRSPYTVFVE